MSEDRDQKLAEPSVKEVDQALHSFWQGSFDELDRLVDETESDESGICTLFADIIKDTPSEDVIVPKQIGEYTILREIGHGGMAFVYEAKHERTGRTVALKVIRHLGSSVDKRKKLFRRELESLVRLKHPNIATMYDAGQTSDGQHFFAMELIKGMSLAEYLSSEPDTRTGGQPTIKKRLELFRKICDAIQYAHQRGVIHCDLKPSNIFIDDQGNPKILDFGLARVLDVDVSMSLSMVDAGKIIGTLTYMSPEQAQGHLEEIDVRSDVYSLGIILFEMLTGRLPYGSRHVRVTEAIRNACETMPTRPGTINPGLRGDLETIMLKALEKDPAIRYQAAVSLAGDIKRYLTDQPILARSPTTIYQLQKLVRRHKLAAALMVVLFVISIAFAIIFGIQTTRVAEERDKAQIAAQRAERTNDFFEYMLASVNPEAQGPEVLVVSVLDKAASGIDVELRDSPDVLASLHDTIGRSYLALRFTDKAQRHLRAALELRRELYGERHPLYAASLHQMGQLAATRHNPREALRIQMEAYELRREILGNEHPDIAESLSDIAAVHKAFGDFDKAEQLCKQAMAMRRRLGVENRDLAHSVMSFGMTLVQSGRFDEAEPFLTEALNTQRRLLGEDHIDIAVTLMNYGEVYYQRADYDAAERIYREQIKILRKNYDYPNHFLAIALSDLALTLHAKGQLKEAEAFHCEAIDVQDKAIGPEHMNFALNLNNYAWFLKTQGRYREAEPLCRKVYRLWASDPELTNPGSAYASQNLADILIELGQFEEAEKLHQYALRAWKIMFADQHPKTAVPLTGLGRINELRGDHTTAEDYYRQALKIRNQQLGELHPETAEAMTYLGNILEMQDKPGAEVLYDKAISAIRTHLPNHRPDLIKPLCQLAMLKVHEREFDDAAALIQEALTIERSLQREKHPNLALCLVGLAKLRLAEKDAMNAEPLLREALDIQQTRLANGDKRTETTLSALKNCLIILGREDEAETLGNS